ncbi:MAG: leukotriene A4 hydrolase C-terminal domain-containing protein, partial [Xanthomonadaceae bacterium]|nr:leukotriene A4 hydrolase C-terminal domain-containing protein [Xanthomonadaceae bacterium]
IMEEVFGDGRARMEAALAYRDLVDALAELGPHAQILAIDLRGQHADDVFTRVPYAKGMFFLRWLEDAFGRDTFDAFLRGYFDRFAFESITTDQFEAYLAEHLLDAYPGTVTEAQVREWIHEPGLPNTLIVPQSDAFDRVDAVRTGWEAGEVAANAIDTSGWTVHEWRHFLGGLPRQMDAARLAELDATFEFTASDNYMIVRDWLQIAIRNQYRPAYERLEVLLNETGRMLLVVPLYKALMDSGQHEFARRVYADAKPGYHPIAIAAVDPIVSD